MPLTSEKRCQWHGLRILKASEAISDPELEMGFHVKDFELKGSTIHYVGETNGKVYQGKFTDAVDPNEKIKVQQNDVSHVIPL